ncbi:MAG: bifunctional methylenetetrahydrofolate dehydrogenase/methenyltetrahydrofolate cyclohydrolase FolD [Clostridia bacterium]|nr:bifunctional methylenetetrahydrofolate dehydrogenase/methenyltetrahydrofolate cyclohydrolase FolD [Clostridia bacterium]
MAILDGKSYSIKLRGELKVRADKYFNDFGRKIGLAVVIIGEDPASKIYVNNKIKATEEVGMKSFSLRLPETISQEEAELQVKNLAENPEVDGIIVQLPLPKKFDTASILKHIPAEKDVDGLCTENLGKLVAGEKTLVSCTPYGIIKLLEEYGVEFSGKNAVVIGRSNMVGKPIASLLLQKNCTVTTCHSRTQDIKKFSTDADILVVAIGKDRFVTGDMVKEGAVVVDVGINRVDGKLYGDVDFESASKKASLITPVPGGVGPMTVTMLMYNTVLAAFRSKNADDFQ